MFSLKIETYLKIIFTISLISLTTAYFVEYVLGHQPCSLCLIERIPYAASIILIILNYLVTKNNKILILLLIFIFIFSFSVSIYHLGIEQGFFEESAVCGLKNTSEIISKEDLLKQLSKRSISCKDVTFRIFGLSLTSVNIVISFMIFFMLTKIYFRYEEIKSKS